MKKIGSLMKELGFNPNSEASAQEAFIKHLIKASTGHSVITPSEKTEIQNNPSKIFELKKHNTFQQMSFEFLSSEQIEAAETKKTKAAK